MHSPAYILSMMLFGRLYLPLLSISFSSLIFGTSSVIMQNLALRWLIHRIFMAGHKGRPLYFMNHLKEAGDRPVLVVLIVEPS